MQTSAMQEQNAITNRVDIMREYWKKASKDFPKVFRWFLKTEEEDMVEAFQLMEESEHAELPDIFVHLDTPFKGIDSYTQDLLINFEGMHQATMKEYKNEFGGVENWEIVKDDEETSSELFLKNMANFVPHIKGFEDNFILFLNPSEVDDEEEWQAWIRSALEIGLPDNVCFMVRDTVEQPVFDDLNLEFGDLVATMSPDLKIRQAIRQAATAGDASDPGVQFRFSLFEMSEAAAKNRPKAIINWGKRAIKSAKRSGQPHMIIAAHITTGTFLLNLHEFDKALDFYNKAEPYAVNFYNSGDKSAAALCIQVYASQGAAFFSANDYTNAIQPYKKMAEFGEKTEDWISSIEGWRMAAYCQRQIGNFDEAGDYNWKSIHFGEKLPFENRAQTTLPYAAKEIMYMAEKQLTAEEIRSVDSELSTILGEWRQYIRE